MTNYESFDLAGDAPVALVSTLGSREQINAFGLEAKIQETVDTLCNVLGERHTTFLTPYDERTLGTTAALQDRLNRTRGNGKSDLDLSLIDELEKAQLGKTPDAIRNVMTAAALRGVWSLDGNTGLVIVTGEHPIRAVLNAQEQARGIHYYNQTDRLEPGRIVLVDPDAIGYEEESLVELKQEAVESDLLSQGIPAKNKFSKFLDRWVANPHNSD